MDANDRYSTADLGRALCVRNDAVIQARRGRSSRILTLNELKTDAEALAGLVARARALPTDSVSFHEIGDLLPRLAYWHQQAAKMPSVHSTIVNTQKVMRLGARTDEKILHDISFQACDLCGQ